MEKSGVRLASIIIICAILIGVLGTGIAYAASGYEEVGGGYWTWETIPNFRAKSSYLHRSSDHSASAQVGSGNIVYKQEPPNVTAVAVAWGVGTTRVWWDVD